MRQQGADGARDVFVGEDGDDVSAPLDLAVQAFERIDGVDRPMIFQEP
jgi:hypothetical protein